MLMPRIAVIMLFVCCFSDHSAAQIMDANDSSFVDFEKELGELDIDVEDSTDDPEERRVYRISIAWKIWRPIGCLYSAE